MRLAFAIAGALLFVPTTAQAQTVAAQAQTQIAVTTDAYGPFSSATFVQDPQSNIVMTLQRAMGRNGYGVDFRGLRIGDHPWEVEYFCEPDSVLIVGEPGQRVRSYYLPYLAWADDLFLSQTQANAEVRRTPSMGSYASDLPRDVEIGSPPVDISEDHILRQGAGFVQTVVQIKNRANSPQRVTYVYQDGAFMWFPDGDQTHVESIRIVADLTGAQTHLNSISAGSTPVGSWQFVGTFNREHGVVAGILTTNHGDIAGILGDYIGVRQIERGGVAYFRSRANPTIPNGEGGDVRGAKFDIRFIALDFGSLQPGEQKQQYFNRIMTVLPPASRSEAGIEAWVEEMVRRVQGVSP